MTVPAAEVERRLRADGWFIAPPLGADEALAGCLEQDATTVRAAGTTAAALGGALGELLAAATGSDWSRPVSVGPLKVELVRRRGVSTCPWAAAEHEPCAYGDGGRGAGLNQFHIRDTNSGLELKGFVLTAHLIREHGFFGGVGTVWRIDPAGLVALLGKAQVLRN